MEVDIDKVKREVDCIYVEFDQIAPMLDWKKKHHKATYYPDRFIFNEGLVVYKGLSQRSNGDMVDVNHLFKVINENTFENAIVTSGKIVTMFYIDRAEDNRCSISFSNSIRKNSGFVEADEEEKANQLGQCIVSLLSYVSEQEKERIHVEERRAATKKGNMLNVKKRKVVTITNKIYEYEKSGEKREFNRLTESWGVRGHWRQYKSGKKSWVKPHVKGRGENEAKEYRLG